MLPSLVQVAATAGCSTIVPSHPVVCSCLHPFVVPVSAGFASPRSIGDFLAFFSSVIFCSSAAFLNASSSAAFLAASSATFFAASSSAAFLAASSSAAFLAAASSSAFLAASSAFFSAQVAQRMPSPFTSFPHLSVAQILFPAVLSCSTAPSSASAGTAASSMARANIMANNLFFIKRPPSLFALPASFANNIIPLGI